MTVGTHKSGGPRIKHVCRRASVALGFSPARYEGRASPAGSPKLSALPNKERKKLFTSDGKNNWSTVTALLWQNEASDISCKRGKCVCHFTDVNGVS